MKTIYTLLFFVLVLGLVACQAEDDTSMKNTGYLSMDITTNNSTATKAGSEEVVYNPKQLAVTNLEMIKEVSLRKRMTIRRGIESDFLACGQIRGESLFKWLRW